MAKNYFGSTSGGRRNQRRHVEGRGSGLGSNYKPQFKTHEVPSRGRSTRMRLDGRVAHSLSDLEYRFLLELRWDPVFSEIREQVPLPLEETLAIAEAIGARHPTIPGDGAPVVMTTDFIYVHTTAHRSILCARAIKPSEDIDLLFANRNHLAKRWIETLERLEIERRYWQARGVDWRLVCEHDLDRTRAANITLFLNWEGPDPIRGPDFWNIAIELTLSTLQTGRDWQLCQLGRTLDDEGKLNEADFMVCVRHLCATRMLQFDMSVHFGPQLRACDLTPTIH